MTAQHDTTGTAAATRGRDRPHDGPPRHHRVNARFNDDEYAELVAAAAAAGWTPAGYLVEAALGAIRGVPAGLDVEREALAQLQRELFAARNAVGRIGGNLNQAVAALNATGTPPSWLAHAVALCEQRMARIDAATAVVHHQLGRAYRWRFRRRWQPDTRRAS